jgi:hypothetical protein
MIKSSFSVVLAIALGVLATPATARDQQCTLLDTLRVKYAGVQLTADQKVLAVKLTSWYIANCGKHEVADVKAPVVSSIR